jgi:MFS family permease
LGFILGPAVAFIALELTDNNYAAPAFLAAAFSLASILLTLFWFEETLPAEQRGESSDRAGFSLRSLLSALTHPTVGLLLMLIFMQQLAFGEFEQLLALYTLTMLGINASGNTIIFIYVGVIVVAVQGYFIGRWSQRFGDRRLVYAGLGLLAIGLTLLAATPRRAVPWYSEAELTEELNTGQQTSAEAPATDDLSVNIPPDASRGWLGLAWILAAMVPLAVGGGMMRPVINSLITKCVEPEEVGGMLGISVSFVSAANAIAPLIGGVLFQAIGPRAPFFFGGGLMIILLGLALWRLDAGREESGASGWPSKQRQEPNSPGD